MSKHPIPFSTLGRLADPPVISNLMAVALENPSLLSLAAGFTNTQTLPKETVRDAVVQLSTSGKEAEYLQYGTTQGRLGLRKFLSKRLSWQDQHQSPAYHPHNFMLTNGSQQALYLAMQVLCDPGDIVLVESPSYFVFLELLKGLGIEAIGIPVGPTNETDPEGMRDVIRKLKAEGRIERLKAVYLQAWYANPSTRSLTRSNLAALASVLEDEGLELPVLEDGAYRDLYFDEAHPAPSILAMPEWDAFPRLYFGTFTKPFATGLKCGFAVCDHEALRDKMLHIKGHQDFGSAHFPQAILQVVVENGSYDKLLEGLRKSYFGKMQLLHGELLEEGIEELDWSWDMPEGGLYLWLTGPEHLDTSIESEFCKAAVDAGVLYVPGDLCFAPGGPKNCMRLSFGVLNGDDLREAARRLAKVMRDFS